MNEKNENKCLATVHLPTVRRAGLIPAERDCQSRRTFVKFASLKTDCLILFIENG